MNSIWAGSSVDAFFNGESFDKNRILQKPEFEANGRNGANEYYIIGVDVARKNTTAKGCDTVATVIKVKPVSYGAAQKLVVAMYTLTNMHFRDQAAFLKKLFYKYKAKRMVIDGNGNGIGLLDEMVMSSGDKNTDDYLPSFGFVNDDEGYYDKYIVDDTEQNAIFIMKAHAPENTIMYANFQAQLFSGKLKFLIDERIAKQKLNTTVMGQKMTHAQKDEYLRMFTLTSRLRSELMNLKEKSEGVNIILEPVNKSIGHDTVSSLGYGLYYIKLYEDSKHKSKKRLNKELLRQMVTVRA